MVTKYCCVVVRVVRTMQSKWLGVAVKLDVMFSSQGRNSLLVKF